MLQSRVMKKAHEMKSYFNMSWSEVLKRAWAFVKASAKEVIQKVDFVEIKNLIEGNAYSRPTGFQAIFDFSALMQVADKANHFTAKIIEKALRGGYVSEKQAWCVAYFAKNNGFSL